MKKQIIEIEVYIITKQEIEVLKQVLNYAWHRLEKHQGTGLHKIHMDADSVDQLRKSI